MPLARVVPVYFKGKHVTFVLESQWKYLLPFGALQAIGHFFWEKDICALGNCVVYTIRSEGTLKLRNLILIKKAVD